MAESKSESARKQQRDAGQNDVRTRASSIGLTRLTQAVGECVVELAAGSARAAGGLVTDIAAAVVEPCDRITRSGSFANETGSEADDRSRSEIGLGQAINRAIDGVTDTVVRSQDRLQKVLDDDTKSGA